MKRAALALVVLAAGCDRAAGIEELAPGPDRHLCVDATCAGTCAAGFADCNADIEADGCEADLTQVTSCGACGVACEPGQVCTPRGCSWPSCADGLSGQADCGPTHDGDCCASLDVPGGTFYRHYNGVDDTGKTWPATVSAFRLDKYEVTVGRFRAFLDAEIDGGWRPPDGSGKHVHLPSGGLNGGTEPGWLADQWTLPTTRAGWWDGLSYDRNSADQWAYSPVPGAGERRPINYVNFLEVYAFCIWDGGFLPTQAEWEFAAVGGDEQRVYPWSVPPTSAVLDDAHAVLAPTVTRTADVGMRPAGDGRWGHSDLAGNAKEFELDIVPDVNGSDYPLPCVDCAHLGPIWSMSNAAGGGHFASPPVELEGATRRTAAWVSLYPNLGARCARVPGPGAR